MQQTWNDLSGHLADGGHVLAVRVYYEDTDFTGLVYHGSYVRFFERGRSDFLRLCGIHHAELGAGLHGPALAFAVRQLNVSYLRPARIDDVLEIRTQLVEARGARIRLLQRALRGDELLTEADVTVAVITADGRPTRLPAHLAQRLENKT
ncbi:YbgC/FadM family acyl-CoA thioesterase [Pannonibacter tanglangensis]|uniref:YbgC/FadM family acyl-CoA thioesterase n=1 Tax=Pannonibacter tanglangensis TaxID=2750084 RepID=A0ABW9ZK11_9HYPH|nr:YbgC/FadM family acyl-CoA thioesterase [Pannonibacter sp. XCT-34]NBN65243.1 YbgC/FadM family acyl-CoA thioesterase [Pannonibacter sp. XCT-34]